MINEYLINKIEKLHYSYLINDKYTNIKTYLNQNKLEYTDRIDIEIVNNSIKTGSFDNNDNNDNNNIDNNDDNSWEQVTTKKGKGNNSNKDTKKSDKYTSKSIDTNETHNQYSGNLITIIDMDTNYISKINQEIVNDFSADIEDIEPDIEFLEYVDSEPDSNYDHFK